MLVTVTGFGSVWRRRFGKEPADPRRFVRAAYYNTTGVKVNGKVQTRPRIIGHARFNGVGGFDPNHPSRLIGRVFECAEPCVWQGQNKILFQRLLRAPEPPDYFLVVVRPDDVGQVDLASRWRSDTVLVLSFSECREEQETMLLLPAYSWIRSSLGKFWLEPRPEKPWTAMLRLGSAS